MKIVYFTSSVNGSGGLDRVLSIKANYLADKLGHEVTIVTVDNGGGRPFFNFSSKINFINLGIGYEGYNVIDIIFNRIKQRRKLKKKLKQIMFELKPEIAISMFQNEAPLLPSIKDGSIKIIENHSARYYKFLTKRSFRETLFSSFKFHYSGWIAEKYDAHVTLTNEDKNDWPTSKKIHVIPNPLPIKCNQRANFTGKRVLSVGRMTYEKGLDNMIKAWSIVERKHPDWELVIIGAQDDVEYVNYIKGIIRNLGLKRVVLQNPTKTIEQEYLKGNMIVMTSNFEGLPLVLIEGMSVGLPLISFDCKCGPSDIIKDGENGFLVKGKNIEVFADRVCRLIEDKKLHAYMSDKAIEYSKFYEVENIMSQWTALFEKLLELKTE